MLFGDVTIPFTSYALIDYRKSWISLGDLAKLVPLFTECGLTEVVARSCSTILPNPSSVPIAKNYSVTINFFLWSSTLIPLSDEIEKWPLLSGPLAGTPPPASSSYSSILVSDSCTEISLCFLPVFPVFPLVSFLPNLPKIYDSSIDLLGDLLSLFYDGSAKDF